MFFPLFVDLSEKTVLIAGAGRIAARRCRTLCGFAGHITVIAPAVDPGIRELTEAYPVEIRQRPFEPDDLSGADFVLAATDDAQLNRSIYRMCRERGIPANSCSDKTMCDFQFPSVIRNGDVVIGINASGKNHTLVKETRIRLERALEVSGGYEPRPAASGRNERQRSGNEENAGPTCGNRSKNAGGTTVPFSGRREDTK